MKIAVISITESGRRLSQKIKINLDKEHEITRYAFEKYTDDGAISFGKLNQIVENIFNQNDALVFLSACGIAVRVIAPCIKSKLSDPAVIVIDEQGNFVISLLSGHIGEANYLTKLIAKVIGAMPVITTATDSGGKFSPDMFAVENGLHICEIDLAKEIAARIVDGKKIGFYNECEWITEPVEIIDDKCYIIGICISDDITQNPFDKTLHLVPRNIVIGIGCKREIEEKALEDFIFEELAKNNISIYKVQSIATIDLKRNEKAILAFSQKYKIPVKFYTANELMKVNGSFSGSEFVKNVTGADNICERSAVFDGGTLIVKKQIKNGMTFAAAILKKR